ncbi:MAG: hypothetical protein QXI19_05070 [Candidatus Caldarchaeum sp.]
MVNAILLTLVLASTPCEVPPPQQVNLSQDPRLQRPITLSVPGQMVKEILSTIGKEVNLALSSEEPYAQDILALRCSEVPAHEVLQKLAEHLSMEWRKDNSGYRLIKTEEERKKEEEERLRQWLEPYEMIQANIRKEIEDEASGNLSEEKVNEERKLLREKVTHSGGYRYAAPVDLERIDLLERLLDPGYKIARQVIASLGPKDFAELEEWGMLVFSSHPTPMQKPLPPMDPSFHNTILATAQEQYRIRSSSSRNPLPPFSPHSLKVVLLFSDWGSMVAVTQLIGADRTLLARPPFTTEDKPIVGEAIPLHGPSSQNLYAFRPSLSSYSFPKPSIPVTANNDPTPKGTLLDRAISLRGHMAALQLGDAYPEAMQEIVEKMEKIDEAEPLGWVFGELLLQVSEQTGVNFIGDLWDAYLHNIQFLRVRVGGRTGREYLSALGNAVDAKIKEEGNWVRMEASKRAFYRMRQFPREPLKTMSRQARNQECLTLDQFATATLPIKRLHLPNQYFSWLREIAVPELRKSSSLEANQFWGALTPTQKQALRSGNPLSIDSLSPQAKALLWKCLLNSYRGDELYLMPPMVGSTDQDPTLLLPRGLEEGTLHPSITTSWTLIVRERLQPQELPDLTMPRCLPVENLQSRAENLERIYDLVRVRYARDQRINISLSNYPWAYTYVDNPSIFSPISPFNNLPDELRRLLEPPKQNSPLVLRSFDTHHRSSRVSFKYDLCSLDSPYLPHSIPR